VACVLVTGPAGLLGSAVIPRLLARGHEVRALVHQTPPAPLPGVHLARGDVRTGAGLAEAVTGVDTVIHAATSPWRRVQATEVGGTRQLLRAAESVGAHLIYPSIVGADQFTAGYYRAKWRAEQLVAASRLWTIQRATQFHPLIDRMLSHRLFPVTAHLAFQPVDADEICDRLIDLVEAGPSGRAGDFGGPQVLPLRAIAAALRAATGRSVTLIRVPAAGPLRPMDAGRHLCPGQALGTMTWQAWLARQPAKPDHFS
jgi:uncharacterized protein YbjT (DUF2867 family)